MHTKLFSIFILIATIIILCCQPMQGKPLDNINSQEDVYTDGGYNGNLDKKTIEQLRQCDMDLETMELCMRCAKITKSTIVYPLCCANEDKIKDWCHDYVFYGVL